MLIEAERGNAFVVQALVSGWSGNRAKTKNPH
jgi:hypothetical protein